MKFKIGEVLYSEIRNELVLVEFVTESTIILSILKTNEYTLQECEEYWMASLYSVEIDGFTRIGVL